MRETASLALHSVYTGEIPLVSAEGSVAIGGGETHVGGCDDLYRLESEGRLDALLA